MTPPFVCQNCGRFPDPISIEIGAVCMNHGDAPQDESYVYIGIEGPRDPGDRSNEWDGYFEPEAGSSGLIRFCSAACAGRFFSHLESQARMLILKRGGSC